MTTTKTRQLVDDNNNSNSLLLFFMCLPLPIVIASLVSGAFIYDIVFAGIWLCGCCGRKMDDG
jgi:hypothetical protein